MIYSCKLSIYIDRGNNMNSLIIKTKLIEKGYSVISLSNEINCNPMTITNWIHNRNNYNIKIFLKLMQALDLKPDDLI